MQDLLQPPFILCTIPPVAVGLLILTEILVWKNCEVNSYNAGKLLLIVGIVGLGQTSINADNLSGNIRSFLGRQEQHRPTYIVGLPKMTHGNCLLEFGQRFCR
jgi:hypothetical protein